MARILLVIAAVALCAAVVMGQPSSIAQTVLSNMDLNVDPCTDFYNYSCGGWLATHQIPGDKSRIDRSFEPITDRNNQILAGIVQNGTNALMNTFYSACMDLNQIQSDGAAPVLNIWNALTPMTTDFEDLASNLAVLFQNGMSGLYELGSSTDASTPTQMIYMLAQGGLSLPDPSYYYDDTVYPLYINHIAQMLQLAGANPGDATGIAQFEKALANITVSPDQLFDPFKSFNKMDWADLDGLAPNVKFDELVIALQLNLDVDLTLDAPAYFNSLSALLPKTSPSVVYNYLRWRVLHWFAPRLSQPFVTANFDFYGAVLSGLSQPQARSKYCITETEGALPQLAGRLFVEAAFPASSKYTAGAMLDSIVSAFEISVQKLDWMDPDTANKAVQKLSKILVLVGYPDSPRNYTSYMLGPSFAKNVLIATRDDFTRSMAEAGGPSNRRAWPMEAFTVNAAYSPEANQIVIPAGILQTPFFDPTFPNAMNYGGIGMVGGHELTHSLDSQGRDFDGNGKLVDWWAPQTSQEFQKRVDCIIAQYSRFSPLPGYFVNGNLTQGENIADAGGLKMAHLAYTSMFPDEVDQPSIVPGLTNDQLFFVGFAQGWCSKLTPAAIRQRLLTDPHSPPKFRVNGPAINTPAFSDAFKCPLGTPMNPGPNGRCQIW